MRTSLAAALALMATALLPAAAAAQAPANDARDAAAPLSLPASVQGTTDNATLEEGEPAHVFGTEVTGSVWYAFSTAQARRLVIRLRAEGDLDAAIEIYRRSRSQLLLEGGQLTGEDGRADLVIESRADGEYLLRVAQRANSVSGQFQLDVFLPQPPPSVPGRQLPVAGGEGAVDPLSNSSDAWSTVLRSGVTYRIHLVNASDRALQLGVYAPGTKSFSSDAPIRYGRSYLLFTPGADQGGRYSFLVSSTGLAGRQPYRLRVAPAGSDDMWPGVPLRNYDRVRGTFASAGLDVVDTYRFDLAHRSAVTVDVDTRSTNPYGLRLLTLRGRRVASLPRLAGPFELARRLKPGRYVVVVTARRRSRGAYTIRRVARTVTHLALTRTGRGPVAPGTAAELALRLRPGVSGRATLTVERFDALTGWHFVRTLRTRIRRGRATVAYRPPEIGRWRVRAVFERTRRAQRSEAPKPVEFTVGRRLNR